METVKDFIFLGSKNMADGDCSHEIKRRLLLGKKSYNGPRQHIKKQRNQISNCQHSLDHGKRKRVPESHLFLLYWLWQSLWVWITINCGKFWKRWEFQTTWPASWKICMQVKKKQLELDMEKQTGSKLRKEYVKAVYCHPAYFTYMQNTSCEMLAGWSSSWNQDCWEKYQ